MTRYRCTHLAEALLASGHSADVTWIGAPVIRIDHDIVVLHRICANVEGMALADAVEKSGATLVYGADDLVFAPGIEELPQDVASHADLHAAMLTRAKFALLSTDALAEAASQARSNVEVIGNFPGEEQLQASPPVRQKRELLTLGYFSGSATHDADLAHIAAPLTAFLAEKRESVRLRIVGPVAIPDIVAKSGVEIERLPSVPWRELLALLARCDVNLAPLAPTRLNRGKSAIKWQEAALAGVPTIASPVGEFVEVIAHGRDGLLCAAAEDWSAALRLLLHDPSRRAEVASAACVAVHNIAKTRRQRIPSVFERAMPSGPTRGVRFHNPRGFAKAAVKKALGR